MGFENGHSKAGGRKRGRANRRTENLIELLDQHGYSPVADLIEIATLAKEHYKRFIDPAEPLDEYTTEQKHELELARTKAMGNAVDWMKIGVSCASGILPYVYPKRKPADLDADLSPEELGKKTTEDLIRMAEQTISELKQ